MTKLILLLKNALDNIFLLTIILEIKIKFATIDSPFWHHCYCQRRDVVEDSSLNHY